MDTPLLATKLFVPEPRPGTRRAPPPYERLERRAQRLTDLVTAPPGFGKTTILSQWVGP